VSLFDFIEYLQPEYNSEENKSSYKERVMIEGLEEITEEQGIFPTESKREISLCEESIDLNRVHPITSIHSPNLSKDISAPLTSHHPKKGLLRINLAEDFSLEGDNDNLSDTHKFDLPSFEKTLKNKELVSLGSVNRQVISEVHATVQKASINIPKAFEKNMKQTHRVYLKADNKIEMKTSQRLDTKKLKEIPLKKESMSKKTTNDIEIDFF